MDEFKLTNCKDKAPTSATGSYETVNVLQLFPTSFFPAQSQVITVPSMCNSMELHPLEIEVQRSNELRRQNQSVIQTAKQHIIIQDTSKVNEGNLDGHHIIWRNNEAFSDSGENPSETGDGGMTSESDIPLTVQFCIESESATKLEVSSDDEFEQQKPVFDHEPDPDIKLSNSEKDCDSTNSCYMCFKKFRQKKNMYAHIRKIHSSQPKIQGGIICPMCEMHSLRHEHLRQHLESLHSIKIHKEEKIFSTIEEFEVWKANIEKETFSCFISKGSAKLLAGIQTKSYFKCHRSGACPIKLEPRKRKQKKQGSYKIGVTCPAAIEVTENVHGILVTYWSTHIGHNMLSDDRDKLRVQGLLGSGMPWDEVLDLVQSDEKPITSKIREKGLHCLSKEKKMLAKKPKTQKLVKSISQSTLIEKADRLLNFLETTEVAASFRPLISNMIDNLTSIAKRRSVEPKQQNSFKSVIQGTYSNAPGSMHMTSLLKVGLERGRERDTTKPRKGT